MRQAAAVFMRPDPWPVLVGADLSGCSVAMAGDQPVTVVPGGEIEQRQAQRLDGFEVAHPEQVLFQRSDEAFGDAVALGLAHEGRRGVLRQGYETSGCVVHAA